jgi:hypothetical protein
MSDIIPAGITFIFIDESGDLGECGSKYFIIVALETFAPLPVGRIIKKARQKFFKNKDSEIKGSNTDDRIRRFVLKSLSKCKCSIHVSAVEKGIKFNQLLQEKNRAYDYICGILLGSIYLSTDSIFITVDKRHSKKILRKEFDEYVTATIKKRSPGIKVKIEHRDSFSSNELMVVDFVAWAAHRYFSHNDASYYDIIRQQIRNVGYEKI